MDSDTLELIEGYAMAILDLVADARAANDVPTKQAQEGHLCA